MRFARFQVLSFNFQVLEEEEMMSDSSKTQAKDFWVYNWYLENQPRFEAAYKRAEKMKSERKRAKCRRVSRRVLRRVKG